MKDKQSVIINKDEKQNKKKILMKNKLYNDLKI